MNSRKIICTALVLLTLCACKKNLQKLPTATLGEPAFWKTSADAIAGVNGIYNTLQSSNMYGDFMRQCDAFTDNAFSQFTFNYYLEISQNQGFSSASALPSGVWSACYNGIARANAVLYNVPSITMDTTLRRRLLGEAYFLRGLYYFHLTNLWGDVPLITTPITVDQEYVTRTPKATVLNQLLSDLTIAEATLPASYTGSDVGRATSAAATSLKSRVYLYNKMWAQAAASASKVMSIAGLNLLAAADWGNQFLPAKENNTTESIFEVQFLGGTGSKLGSSFNANSGALPNFSDTYDPEQNLLSAFEAGDIRLPATILRPGDVFAGVTYTGSTSPTKIALRKSIIPDATVTTDGSANFIVIRFAEILLNYAEAQNEAASTPDATVYAAVNRIRTRAGLANLAPNLTQDAMRTAIKKERRVELAFEGHHFFDLLRWGGADYQAAMQAVTGAVATDVRTYNAKLLLWPVPQSEVNINAKLLPQNAGW